jgi:hydroxylaminobenzene mutase
VVYLFVRPKAVHIPKKMNSSLLRQGQWLLRIGILFILYSSVEGFVIPYFASSRIGLSVHTLGALEAVLLLALGLLWPRLALHGFTSRVAFWCLLYSAVAILAAYTIAAVLGVGNETIVLAGELPHGLHHGSAFQETVIKVLSYSSAPTGPAAFALVLYGLRTSDTLSAQG